MSSRVLLLLALSGLASADGTGILGAGKWLYKPVCAHTCRYVLRGQHLQCRPPPNVTHSYDTTSSGPHGSSACFLVDASFLKTTALCIEEYCAVKQPGVSVSEIEVWWEGHLAMGTVGDWSKGMRPVVTYAEALRLAGIDRREKEDQRGGGLPRVVLKEWLNETSWVDESLYTPWYNYQNGFQVGEFWHGYNSLIIAGTSIGLPILLSLLRFLPGHSRLSSRLQAILSQPLLGHRHRSPLPSGMGTMPTRGQSLFILYILVANVVLMCVPVSSLFPNARFQSKTVHRLQVMGDRAGVLAFALYVSLFLFSARNNILLWVTDWSHATYLLLHRWIAYACILQTVAHSVLLLAYFVVRGDHDSEARLPYWYWGIMATLATVIMWPLAALPVRRRMYEVFLAVHQVLAAFVLVAAFLHIWYLYKYDWGYEIWIYAAGGIWFVDRAVRVMRIAAVGRRTARVTVVGENSDLLRMEIDDVVIQGHVYLFFPSLNWRVWESHPFSVLSSFTGSTQASTMTVQGVEKPVEVAGKHAASSSDDERTNTVIAAAPSSIRPRAVLLIRPQSGTTRQLLERTRTTEGGSLSLSVLIEASYHSTPATRSLSNCSTLVAIAGGVGITAVVPLVRSFGGPRARVFWGVRDEDIVRAVEPEIRQLEEAKGARIVQTTIGSRMAVREVVREEVMRRAEGPLGVVVCGPPGMADDVRRALGEVVGGGRAAREVVFVDEAFSW